MDHRSGACRQYRGDASARALSSSYFTCRNSAVSVEKIAPIPFWHRTKNHLIAKVALGQGFYASLRGALFRSVCSRVRIQIVLWFGRTGDLVASFLLYGNQ